MATLPQRADRPAVLTVGTVVWLASELLFFAGLFAAYFTLRGQATGPWPPAGVHLETGPAALFTGFLVASSATMHRAEQAAHAGRTRAFRQWLALTLLLALGFLANQAREWRTADFSASTHPYGSAFYLMTGFHGAHVLGGIVAMVMLLGRLTGGRRADADLPAIGVITAYWHFVDVVWVAMFSTLFLIR